MTGRTKMNVNQHFSLRKFTSAGIAAISLFVLFSRALNQIGDSRFLTLLLRAEAKCPGLPFGSTSGGPDLIDLAIDGALAVVAALFIALTIRDLRRRKKAGNVSGESSTSEDDDL
ncbi:MAG: hypothetical protein ACHQ1H_10425 [Nitrososphaerales archaeon]